MSGKRDDRPSYQDMLTDVRRLTTEGKRVAVVVWRLDRLGRRLLERVARREELKELGVMTHSATEGGEVNDLTANILASVAQEEVRVLGERIRGAQRHIREQGWRSICPPRFGYIVRDATTAERAAGAPKRVLLVDEAAAAVVREAYERAAAGNSIRSICRWLSALPIEVRGGRSWGLEPVRKMLAAPVYIARNEPEDGGDPLDAPVGRWPAIISDELFRRVREARARQLVLAPQATNRYLLSGFARCPRCQYRMAGGASASRSHRYICDDVTCRKAMSGRTLDASVLDQVSQVLTWAAQQDPAFRRRLEHEWGMLQSANTMDEKRLGRLRAEVEKGRTRLARATTLFIDGKLERPAYDAACEQIVSDTRAAQAELDRLEGAARTPSLPTLDEALGRMGGWTDALMNGDIKIQRQILGELIDHVEPVTIALGRHEAKITWTPLGAALHAAADRHAA